MGNEEHSGFETKRASGTHCKEMLFAFASSCGVVCPCSSLGTCSGVPPTRRSGFFFQTGFANPETGGEEVIGGHGVVAGSRWA